MNYTIDKDLEPTFENVSETFIKRTIKKMLIRTKFTEKEGLEYAKSILQKFYKIDSDVYSHILNFIDPNYNVDSIPEMYISNYKLFFDLLTRIYAKDIELYIKDTNMNKFPDYEMHNFLYYIWARMQPEDLSDPEKFLYNQYLMYYDTSLKKYDDEKKLGPFEPFNNHIISVKNGIASAWDESPRQMEIRIYDKDYYYDDPYVVTPYYLLPYVRYGIYEKDDKKICRIGSIQNRLQAKNIDKDQFTKKIDRMKYKSNKEVPDELIENVEPKNIISLSIFTNILNQEGIYDFEIPNLYVLNDFLHSGLHNKQDLINETKCEKIINNFERLLHHYPNGHIKSYPGEIDHMLHIHIPKIQKENDINGQLFKDMYKFINQKYLGKEDKDI